MVIMILSYERSISLHVPDTDSHVTYKKNTKLHAAARLPHWLPYIIVRHMIEGITPGCSLTNSWIFQEVLRKSTPLSTALIRFTFKKVRTIYTQLATIHVHHLCLPPWLESTCEMTLVEPFLGCSNKTGLPERTKLMRQMVGRLVTCSRRERNKSPWYSTTLFHPLPWNSAVMCLVLNPPKRKGS